MDNKKIVVAGGSGFIGKSVAAYFSASNEVVILSRNASIINDNLPGNTKIGNKIPANIRAVQWNGRSSGTWISEIDGCNVVINLAGKSVNCRYTEKNKKEILESRVHSTEAIGEAIRVAAHPPGLWINSSSATIYRDARDHQQDDYTGETGSGFSVEVCKTWEKSFFDQQTPFTRKIALRTAITLGQGGVMKPYLNLIKFGLGGRQAGGRQLYSWIHIEDVCRAIDFMYSHANMEGAFNLSSPNPVTNKVFMETLRKVTGVRIGLPAQKWMIQLGALLIGTEAELLLKSRWVVPAKLLANGYQFRYPGLEDAFRNIISHTP